MLPRDAQPASRGEMCDVGDMAGQLGGLGRHLRAQDGVEGQREARFWRGRTQNETLKCFNCLTFFQSMMPNHRYCIYILFWGKIENSECFKLPENILPDEFRLFRRHVNNFTALE